MTVILLLRHQTLISQLQRAAVRGKWIQLSFQSIWPFALTFVELPCPLLLRSMISILTKLKKSKRIWSFLPEIREVGQKKIISLYERENTLLFYAKIEGLFYSISGCFIYAWCLLNISWALNKLIFWSLWHLENILLCNNIFGGLTFL